MVAHAQKPDSVFWRNRQVHLNRRVRQFIRLLAADLCASALIVGSNVGYTLCSEVVSRVLATHSIRQFPLHFPSVRHLVPPHFSWSLPQLYTVLRPEMTVSALVMKLPMLFYVH